MKSRIKEIRGPGSHIYHNYCGEKCPDNNCNPLATNEQFYPWKTKEGAATKLSI
jgi:hypothetical protein